MSINVYAFIDGFETGLEVGSFTVQQDATPIIPGDSAGSVGSLSITTRARMSGHPSTWTNGVAGRKITLYDMSSIEGEQPIGRGAISGIIKSVTTTGDMLSISADTMLTRLNTTRDAAPFYGVRRAAPLVAARDNLSTNPSYTAGISDTVFTPGTGAGTLSNPASGGAIDSGAYLQATWTTASTAAGSVVLGPAIAVTANAAYTMSQYLTYYRAAAQPLDVSQRVKTTIAWYTSGGTFISYSDGPQVNLIRDDWYRFWVTGAAPATAAFARAGVITVAGAGYVNPAVGDWLGQDRVLIERASVFNDYFDGDSPNSSWNGAPGLSASSLRIYGDVPVPNYDATIANAFRYYCSLVGIPDNQVIVDSEFEGQPVAYPAWSGNVWVYIKQFCAAIGAEVVADAELIYLRPIRRYEVQAESHSPFSVTVDIEAKSQNIDIYNYNSRWLSDSVAWEGQATYSVNTGESQFITVDVDHSLTSVNSPVAVETMPSPLDYSGGTGVYMIRDSDGTVVSASWWRSQGGSVQVTLTEGSYSQLGIAVRAPNNAGSYKAPFTVGETLTDNPGMFITGSGVFVNKQLIRKPTGASPDQTTTITSATIDNIFISDIETAHSRGFLSAGEAGGPSVTLNTILPANTAVAQKGTSVGEVSFGNLAGARVRAANNIFRVVSATPGLSGVTIQGVADMTFDDLTELFSLTFDEANVLYSGMTFDVFNSLWSSTMTFDGFNALQPSPTFDDINAIFAGMDFNQHTATPYIDKVLTLDNESLS